MAALSVLLCHAVASATCWSPRWESLHAGQVSLADKLTQLVGAAGVGVFFVLSGLCIHLPAARANAELRPRQDWPTYFVRRFRRIYPPHIIVLGLSVAVAAWLPLSLRGVHPVVSTLSWAQTLAHMLLIHTFVPGAFFSGNHVLWSIATEAHFYLLYPLLLAVACRTSWKTVVVALLIVSVAAKTAGKALHLPEESKMILSHSFICRIWEWALGAFVAEQLVSRGAQNAWGIDRLLGSLVAILCTGYALSQVPFGQVAIDIVWPLAFALLLYRTAGMALHHRALGGLSKIGTRSFSLYLVHPVAIALTLYAVRPLQLSPWLELSSMLVVSIAFTWVYYALVESAFLNVPRALVAVPQNVRA